LEKTFPRTGATKSNNANFLLKSLGLVLGWRWLHRGHLCCCQFFRSVRYVLHRWLQMTQTKMAKSSMYSSCRSASYGTSVTCSC